MAIREYPTKGRLKIMVTLLEKVLQENETPLDVLSVIFSNFQKASLRQQRPSLAKLFSALSQSCEIQAMNHIEKDLSTKDRTDKRLAPFRTPL
jgi:hypothetical protein